MALKLVVEPDLIDVESSRPLSSAVVAGYVFQDRPSAKITVNTGSTWLDISTLNAGQVLSMTNILMGLPSAAGGNTTEIQYNNTGNLAGASLLTYGVNGLLIGSGDSISAVTPTTPTRLEIKAGTAASPYTTNQPLFKIEQTTRNTQAVVGQTEEQSGLLIFSKAVSGSTRQAIGLSTYAFQSGNTGIGSTDAGGLASYGFLLSGGVGTAIGGFFYADAQAANCSVNAIEADIRNATGSDIPFNASSGSTIAASLWLNALGANSSGAAIIVSNSFGQQFDKGLAFNNYLAGGKNGPVINDSFYDACQSATSINIQGTHATAAINIASGSGHIVVGGSGSSTNTLTVGNTAQTSTRAYFYTSLTSHSTAVLGQVQILGASTSSGQYIAIQGNAGANHTSNPGTPPTYIGISGVSRHGGTQNTTAQIGGQFGFTHTGAGGTTTTAVAVDIQAGTKDAAATITTSIGLQIAAQTTGTTNWQLFSSGTAPSSFLGSLILGSNSSPSADALLTLTSTTQGLLLPRMTTTQRDAIGSPTAGLMIYNSTTNKINVRVAAAWEAVTSV